MLLKRLGLAGLFVSIGLATAACTDGYGYSGVGVGVGVADGYDYADPYRDGGYGAYGAGYGGYGSSYSGWYDNFYYPGTGVYVYDRYRRAHRWNDGQRRYWEGRRGGYRNGQIRDNWADFRRDYRNERRDYRGDLRDNRQAYRNGTIDRSQFREGRRDARREFRRDVRQDYRQTRQENRAVRNGNPGVGTRSLQGNAGARTGGFRGGARSGGLRGSGGRRNTP